MRAPAALLLALAALAPSALAASCDAAGLPGSALTGTWTVGAGEAQVMGAPMGGGSSQVTLQASGGGLTLGIDGRRMALRRLAADEAPWAWDKGPEVAVTADEALLAFGCSWAEVARYEGTVSGVTWRVMIADGGLGAIHWSMASPVASGLFAIGR